MWVLGHTRCRRSHPVRCNDPSTCPAPTAAIPQVLRFPTLLKAHFYIGRVHLVSRHHPLTLFSASRPSMSVWACVGLVVPLLMHPMAVGPMNSWQNFRTLDSQLSAPPLLILEDSTLQPPPLILSEPPLVPASEPGRRLLPFLQALL